MAVDTEPRFSDSEERSAEQRVDQAYERNGFGLGSLILLAAAVGLILFGAVTGLGHPNLSEPAKIADRSTDQPALGTPVKPLPHVPNTQ